MIVQLQKVLANVTRSMEVFFVMQGVKPCIRIAVKEQMADSVEALCHVNDLYFEKSNSKIAMEFNGSYSTKGKWLKPDSELLGYFFYYIAKSKDIAQKAKAYEQSLNYKKFGEVLGYPDCCIEFFVKNKPEEEQKKNDYVMPALENSSDYVFPYQNNVFVRYFDLAIVSHVPHSFSCGRSSIIAEKNLELLREKEKRIYDHAINLMKSAVIYLDAGIILLKGKRTGSDVFKFNKIIASQPSRISRFLDESLLNGKNIIKILDNKAFELNNVRLNHPILIFE